MSKTNIEWAQHVWNPIAGCSIVSPGCTNCYAMKQAHRIQAMNPGSHYTGTTKVVNGNPVWTGVLKQASERTLTQPLRWTKPRMIFVNSMSDLFHESVPDEWIDRVFAVMGLCPQHTFQVLTKRAARMRKYVTELVEDRQDCRLEAICDHAVKLTNSPCAAHVEDVDLPLPNVWLGVSAEDQTRADERIPHLLATPAAVRFISAEPLLGPLDLMGLTIPHALGGTMRLNALTGRIRDLAGFEPQQADDQTKLSWIIAGGESGPGARPMNPQWARDIRDQCQAEGVAYFHKQNGEYASVSEVEGPGEHYTFQDHRTVRRVGKKRAGRLLDGRTWDQMPGIALGGKG